MPIFTRRMFLNTAGAAASLGGPVARTRAAAGGVGWAESLGAKIERDGEGNVIAADFTGTWLGDADLAKIAQWPKLRRLNISETKVTDLGIEYLKPLREVEEFDAWYAENLTEDGITHLRGWRRLSRWVLRWPRSSRCVFDPLESMVSLRELDIANTNVSDEGFHLLTPLVHLNRLSIGGNRLTGDCLQMLAPLAGLRHLDVSGVQRVDSGLWGLPLTRQNIGRIAQLTRLESLNLNGATLADRGLDRPGHQLAERKEMQQVAGLQPLENLGHLDVGRLPVSNQDMELVRDLPRLEELRAGMASNLDDGLVPHLLAAKSLKRVYLAGTRLTDTGLARLALHPGLTEIAVDGTAVTAGAVGRLQKASRNLTILWWPARKRSEPGQTAQLVR